MTWKISSALLSLYGIVLLYYGLPVFGPIWLLAMSPFFTFTVALSYYRAKAKHSKENS
jgi:hypothetical protein